jgi:repressor LexA
MSTPDAPIFEGGILATTPNGWTIVSRRQFFDEAAAVRWIKTEASSWQKRHPLDRVRGNVIKIKDFLTLEMILEGYEKKRLAGESDFISRCVVQTAAITPRTAAPPFTQRQGQFLAFIYYYTKLNSQPPAEREMERYFKVTAPAVHKVIVTLETKGLISRTPGVGRSIRLLVPRAQLPDLE